MLPKQMRDLTFRRGYIDRKENRNYPADFEKLCEQNLDITYQNGRLCAANILSAGLTLPEWPKGMDMPLTIKDAARTATFRVGLAYGRSTGSHEAENQPDAHFMLVPERHYRLLSRHRRR